VPLQAVIFDLDGVLVDTSKFHAKAWADLVRGIGIEPPPDLEERVRGIARMASLKIALGARAAEFSEEELQRLAERKNACYVEAIQTVRPADLYPGALRLFRDLRRHGVRIGLGSASKNARPVLERLNILPWFDAVADGFAYRHGKPHPDVFLTAARMLGAEPPECIVVEDAAAGIHAALDGGFVAVGIGNPESLRHAHLLVGRLTELSWRRLAELAGRASPAHWQVRREGVKPPCEESYGTLFCVGNGRVGVRGRLITLPAGPAAGTFVAGLYDRVTRPSPDPDGWDPFMAYWGNADLARGDQIEVALINAPDMLDGDLVFEDETVDFTQGELKHLSRRLDLHNGTFTAEAVWRSPAGREIRLLQRRFADLATPSRVWEQLEIEPLNVGGTLRLTARINDHTRNRLYDPRPLYAATRRTAVGDRGVALAIEGRTDHAVAAFGTAITALDCPAARYAVDAQAGTVTVETEVAEGRLLHIDRVAVLATDRIEGERGGAGGPPPDAAVLAAVEAGLTAALASSFGTARIAHGAAWNEYWAHSDLVIEGDAAAQLGARCSIYHLLIAASRDDAGVSIPAKSLSGEGYRGMVFWDTDIHMTPFFNFTQPRLARNLAEFRHRTLDGARRKAARYGFRGAFYPWETGISGDEECERWLKLITHQIHLTADVAYALQQYVDITGDREFYETRAAEVLIETARFWRSRAVANPDGSLSIPDAGGPDEFHVVGHDSAFVNHLAIHNLRGAARAVEHLRRHNPGRLADIRARCAATEAELTGFADSADRIRTMLGEDGRFEQCRGFFQLEEAVPGGRHPRVFETQTVKQADVIMMLLLLPDEWDRRVWQANWDYYEPRCVHASSLSHGAHGVVAAEMGLTEKAQAYIRQSLGMDLNDEMANTAHGAHMAANGMNWTALVRGCGGCRPQGDRFRIMPRLPPGWNRLAFRLKWRGADFVVEITPAQTTVHNLPTARATLPLNLHGRNRTLPPGRGARAAAVPSPRPAVTACGR